ncbi:Nuclear export mediator factor Nemf like protein [Argiope bruennichi]|uniref:Nuclear export mediator factor Nemf like protein n=1 Tax=Argiope bruennichi TaxID=94029 RepID=A0A8T0EBI4_ARGBR|nr:Nuclear export mediator factor Nemf like protein [Argiope bruennichi]
MKTRFSTIDIVAEVNELQKYLGMRVNQIYDVDNKTYLIRLNRYEEKIVILLESGMRIHTTEFEWPKNPSPSGFSMKLRKHIKNKRLENIRQLGNDRIVDLQFGVNDAAYHIILELYDRGNIVLTDFEFTILNILRPRTSGNEDVKLIVREKYPIDKALSSVDSFKRDEISSALNNAKDGDNLKKILMPLVAFGPALLDHVLQKNGFPKNCAVNKHFKVPADINRLFLCLEEANGLMKEIAKLPEGYVIHKVEKNNKDGKEIITNIEFHPFLFHQYQDQKYTHYPSFDKAVDQYFSNMEGQKIDLKAFQKEKEALKKLENVKKDHEKRLQKLLESQEEDTKRAQLIEMNLELVDKALLVIRSAIANQISWSDIQDIIKEAQVEGDPVAKAIKKLKLDINHFTMLLSNPHIDSDDEEEVKPMLVDIDLDFSAYANARKYYDKKRAHAKKEQKTIESSEKAFKNAEKKTKQALKEVAVTTSITKARKVMWFEKFLWFISSENYLVIAGRDVQQNELLVKRYMKANDLYVHADLHGASSVIIKNPKGTDVPPKTLNEAGTMAVCNSTAWDAKIVTSAWWVYSNQVSKTAPSGEYLTTGSFMIRGKKNYLPPAYLIMGFGFIFKLDEESVKNHLNERCEKSEDAKFEPNEEMNDEVADNSDGEESDQSSSSDNSSNKNESIEKEIIPLKEEDDLKNVASNSEVSLNTETINFPDTEVKLDVLSEKPKLETQNSREQIKDNKNKVIIQQHKKKVPPKVDTEEKSNQNSVAKDKQTAPKRGQRGKMKKIKEKYKYQDEEERELRMKILASAGQSKDEKKGKNKKSNNDSKPQTNQTKNPKKNLQFIEILEEDTILKANSPIVDIKNDPPSQPVQEVDAELSDEDDETQLSEELQLLNSLTGCPIPDDTLLYAVPVCGPYSSMLSYKYKVKIIPGSSRRGKAAKTALQIFLHEKTATQREKDLLRSIKDQDISRNLPGKIKISTASYKKVK